MLQAKPRAGSIEPDSLLDLKNLVAGADQNMLGSAKLDDFVCYTSKGSNTTQTMLEKVQITPLQLLNLTNMPFTYMYSYMYVPDRVQGSAVM